MGSLVLQSMTGHWLACGSYSGSAGARLPKSSPEYHIGRTGSAGPWLLLLVQTAPAMLAHLC